LNGRVYALDNLDFRTAENVVRPKAFYYNIVNKALGNPEGDVHYTLNGWLDVCPTFIFDLSKSRAAADCDQLSVETGKPSELSIALKFRSPTKENLRMIVVTEMDKTMSIDRDLVSIV
jgi:hypothetical protein